MEKDQKILLSGVKPTGKPHIGNYFGAMKQFAELQGDYKSYIFVADYHGLNFIQNANEMSRNILDVAIDYLAIGLDSENTILFKQSDVPEVAELAWIFESITTVPYLKRAHAYKDSEAKEKLDELSAGDFNYPMLMAADILIQDADVVPVGQDQKQHLEIARDTAEKFNSIFGETFKAPKPLILDGVATVPGIDGRKMSKSYGNTISLFADNDEIEKQVRAIVTDSKTPEESKDPELCNIFALHKLFSAEQLAEIEKKYRDGGMGYKESKDILIDNIVGFIAPLREKRGEIAKDRYRVLKILNNGGEIARSNARKKMIEVKKKVGFCLE